MKEEVGDNILKLKTKIAQQAELLDVYRSFAASTRLLKTGSPKFNMHNGACMDCGVEYKKGHHVNCLVLSVRRMQRSTNIKELRDNG